VASLTRAFPANARDTVPGDTLASLPTSKRVEARFGLMEGVLQDLAELPLLGAREERDFPT
jgi:hypothetical protein